MRAALVVLGVSAALFVVSPTVLAQTATDPGNGRGGKGTIGPTVVPLATGGDVRFNPDGSFAAVAPGANVTGYFAGNASVAHDPVSPSPPDAPSLPVVDFQMLETELLATRAAHCLTISDASPCDNPSVPSGAFNIVSTDVSLAWLIDQTVQAAWKDVPLPGIVMQANPLEGLAQLESWFWVDRGTYDGQAFSEPVHMPVPWTLDFDTIVHHHDTSNGPCPDDPTHNCPTSHDWDETLHTHENHLDLVDVTVTLSPAHYTWDFGDDNSGPWRQGSHTSFADNGGLGLPYTDPYHASTVTHKYSESSLKVFSAGGFLVGLTATWSASAHIQASRDGAVVQDETRSLDPRVGHYEQRYQVRESWPVLVTSSGDVNGSSVAP